MLIMRNWFVVKSSISYISLQGFISDVEREQRESGAKRNFLIAEPRSLYETKCSYMNYGYFKT